MRDKIPAKVYKCLYVVPVCGKYRKVKLSSDVCVPFSTIEDVKFCCKKTYKRRDLFTYCYFLVV